jgi:hypothetical protein
MNSNGYGRGMETELTTWKSKIYNFIRKIALRESKEREKVLLNNQDQNMNISEMSSRIEHLNNERPTEWASRMKNIDNSTTDMRGKYVLRPQLSWTGLYGKEPWPRERKIWEKV